MLKIKAPDTIDYEKEGLIVGLEFHQQILAPYFGENSIGLEKKHGSKLFCPCAAIIREDTPNYSVERQLRAVSGETGEIDIAAQFERIKNQRIVYEGYYDTTCLVEIDEEPILPINREAFYRSIAIATKIFNLKPFDEILVCRKTIVDGSNTSGFQRTAQIAYGTEDSFITVNGKKITIYQANLEEDSAKNMGTKGNSKTYRVDRLGIPLIEIATGPDMRTPEEVKDTAIRIGTLLRTTGFVKRGLGTIRQDINVSIKRGTRIEIKGVQELDILIDYVRNEAIRQGRMLDLLDELKTRGLTKNSLKSIKPIDVSKVFKKTNAKMVKKSLSNNQSVIAAKLPFLKGLIAYELQSNYRVGTELSEICKVTSGAGGILHSDELPNYGITQEEVDEVIKLLKLDNNDGFILILGPQQIGNNSVNNVARILEIWLTSDPLPPEVRAPRADGTTGFLRPLPGKARMYPETDSPPLRITQKILDKLETTTFEMPEERHERYVKKLKLSDEIARQLVNHPDNMIFEEIVSSYKVQATLVATTMLQSIVDIRRKGGNTEFITEDHLKVIFEGVSKGEVPSSSIEKILTGIASEKDVISVEAALDKYGVVMMSEDEVIKIVKQLISENQDVIKQKGMGAMGTIMGLAMTKTEGKAEGKVMSDLVRKGIQGQL
jgi:glutamyl-tRNA(Gln) amidotransferase subunit E